MSTPKQYIDFNAATVPLEESNLIEASAGTGKTYSIAILVLRLVLATRSSVKEILMVTFTKGCCSRAGRQGAPFIRSTQVCWWHSH